VHTCWGWFNHSSGLLTLFITLGSLLKKRPTLFGIFSHLKGSIGGYLAGSNFFPRKRSPWNRSQMRAFKKRTWERDLGAGARGWGGGAPLQQCLRPFITNFKWCEYQTNIQRYNPYEPLCQGLWTAIETADLKWQHTTIWYQLIVINISSNPCHQANQTRNQDVTPFEVQHQILFVLCEMAYKIFFDALWQI